VEFPAIPINVCFTRCNTERGLYCLKTQLWQKATIRSFSPAALPDYPSASAKALALEEGMQEAEAEESMEGTDFSGANPRWSTQNDEACKCLPEFSKN